MTCQLILMRHAKSSHDDPALTDHDRTLNPRGRRDTPAMAEWLEDQDRIPELILCSSSFRTRETAELLLDHWSQKPVVVSLEDLYLSGPAEMLDVVEEKHGDASSVMVLAHNPGISMLASALANQSLEMVTAAVAIIEVDSFEDLSPSSLSPHAPPSHFFSHLSKQGGCVLSHFASPKTI